MSNKSIRAGKAEIEVGIHSKVAAGMKKVGAQMKRHGQRIASIGAGITGVGAAVTAPLAGAIAHFQTAGDELHKMGIRSRASTEELSQLGFAAEQSGTSMKTVADGMFRMGRRIANAATGGGPAKRALDDLGLSAEKLSKLSSAEQLETVADALGSVESESLAAQYGFELLGDSYKQMAPLLAEGGSGIRALREEADELGLTVSQMDADNAAALGDALNRITRAGKALVFGVGAALGPTLTEWAGMFTEVTKGIRDFIHENRDMVKIIAAVGLALIAGGAAVTALGLGITIVGAAISGIAAGFAMLASPVAIAIIAIVAFGLAIHKYTDFTAKAIDWLTERFTPLIEIIKDTGAIVWDALSNGEWAEAFGALVTGAEAVWLDLTNGIRGYWDDAMNGISKATTLVSQGIAKSFQWMGKAIAAVFKWVASAWAKTATGMFSVTAKIGKMIKEIAPDNALGDKLRGAGGIISALGTVGDQGMQKLVESDFGDVGEAVRGFAGKMDQFGATMSQVAQEEHEKSMADRAAAARERAKRLQMLGGEIAERGKLARERMKTQKDEAEQNRRKMPGLGGLGLDAVGGAGAGESGGGRSRASFSAAALGFMGTADTPMQRSEKHLGNLVGIQRQMLDEVENAGNAPRFE